MSTISPTGRVTVTDKLVVLPGRVWAQELASELERLGLAPERCSAAASKALHRIVGRAAGWPREVFQVAESVDELEGETR